MLLIAEIDQRIEIGNAFRPDIAAASAITVVALQAGLRASEIMGLRDVATSSSAPGLTFAVTARGRKHCTTPLRWETVKVLEAWLKEKALARVTAPATNPERYRPDDKLLAFLESL
jgi:site-specific recombinase XerC